MVLGPPNYKKEVGYMYCEMKHCIYNKEKQCIINKIAINELGVCGSCELVSIPEKSLEKYKNKSLKTTEELWKS